MKILYGITKSNFGGAQRYVFELAEVMKKQGHSVAVLCGSKGVLANKLDESGIKVISLDKMQRDISIDNDLLSFFQILKILGKEKPDVFHINSSKMGGIGTLAVRMVNLYFKLTDRNNHIKAIFTSHGWAFNEPRPGWQKILINFLAWITVLFSHKTICVSAKTKEQISHWPFIKNKLVVIHNGISQFILTARTDINKSLTIGTIGELHKIKGQDILLRAWHKFIRNRDARLVIIGDGDEKQNLVNMAEDMGISGSIDFKGFINDARALLSHFDIFVFPSRSENLPYVVLEAGLAGLPVIATSVGGIPEIIESGVNGILIPPEDSEALYSTLMLLAENEALRKRLGTNLKASIQENFSFEKMVEKTFALY